MAGVDDDQLFVTRISGYSSLCCVVLCCTVLHATNVGLNCIIACGIGWQFLQNDESEKKHIINHDMLKTK